ISTNRDFYHQIDSIEGISHVQVYAHKGAILKTDDQNYGAVIKGISSDFDWSFFKQYIKEGDILKIADSSRSNELLIAENIAQKLQVGINDEILVYFVQQPPRLRKLKISGIYNTGLGEMDDRMVFTDIRHLQKINGWEDHQVGGFEILIKDLKDL